MTDFDIFYQNRGSVITYYTTKKYVVAKGPSLNDVTPKGEGPYFQ